MRGSHSAIRLLAGPAVIVLIAGCAANTGPTPVAATPAATSTAAAPAVTPTAAPATTPTAAASAAAPTPAAVVYGPVAVVAGRDECAIDLGAGSAGPDGVTQYRDGRLTCTASVNDSRVSGIEQGSWNRDWWGPASGPGAGVQWGTIRLENAGGTWEGKATGISSTDRGDVIAVWYTGTGGYAGLSYFELITGKGPWAIRGQIQPGDPPNPEGGPPLAGSTFPPTESVAPPLLPTPVAYGPVTIVEGSVRHGAGGNELELVSTGAGGVQHMRASDDHWVAEMNDPRVSGLNVTDLNMDGWESPYHGAAIQWGRSRTTNAQGAWTGTYTGVYDSMKGDTFVGWSSGSGAYAGLTFFQLGTGDPPNTIQGLVYPGTPPQP